MLTTAPVSRGQTTAAVKPSSAPRRRALDEARHRAHRRRHTAPVSPRVHPRGPFAYERREACTVCSSVTSSLAPVLWRGSGMLTEPRRWHAGGGISRGCMLEGGILGSHIKGLHARRLHAQWPAPRSAACLIRAQLGGSRRRQAPRRRSRQSREAFLIWASSELGVVRQIPRELDAVDDTVGCGDGHHLDVLGGFDGILTLAHLMFGEPSGRQSIAINSNKYQSKAIKVNQWPSVALSGPQWPSVALSGPQWPSVAPSPPFE